ncbi:MAG TPA: hypothetical protein EYG97_05080 [Arcobacter sp.]|nr:hypothetical protein [Arcobacter sp.]HIP56381.1 hypothetical protein [Arcobacter sp.]
MERRNWTLKSLEDLIYIDSLDEEQRANSLVSWVEQYTSTNSKEEIKIEQSEFEPYLNQKQLSTFLELFYKNINFLKNYKLHIKHQIEASKKIKSFLK